MATTAPFDSLASDYDAQFSDRLAAGWLRDAVHECVSPLLTAGDKVVDLGCGTGDDAIRFAATGCTVWAGDASTAMLDRARAKVGQAGLESRIELAPFDIGAKQADRPSIAGAKLVFSNFGALNCVPDLRPVFDFARTHLQNNGYFAAIAMGRFCLFETLYFTARGQFRKAGRRWSGAAQYRSDAGTHTVWYHSASSMRKQAAGFRQIGKFAIGALLPTSEGFDMVDRSPRLFGKLARWDRYFARGLYPLSDHYLLILQKQPDS